ncbi:hypothetical protein AOL_s00109g64 [Orbilia oligospora ATCC 24927]|uniref:F-box domain-containing protein n=1 Tax=Arthrobotrys oligospora (strain ATCC 24927 / CBS 115.81 / DSM 1491) TaxID=756982 RepID=G1XK35_ARTOA|nr:hypothetical protein AOL_s00109g64 [Orbilia oligospora ATCC 24927]EGX46492.1 hypothetical protein AOL_s00109g64 [Orbilia oligospora ATCC 24927]
MSINSLPTEILLKIFSDFNAESIFYARQVCRRWRQVNESKFYSFLEIECIQPKNPYIRSWPIDAVKYSHLVKILNLKLLPGHESKIESSQESLPAIVNLIQPFTFVRVFSYSDDCSGVGWGKFWNIINSAVLVMPLLELVSIDRWVSGFPSKPLPGRELNLFGEDGHADLESTSINRENPTRWQFSEPIPIDVWVKGDPLIEGVSESSTLVGGDPTLRQRPQHLKEIRISLYIDKSSLAIINPFFERLFEIFGPGSENNVSELNIKLNWSFSTHEEDIHPLHEYNGRTSTPPSWKLGNLRRLMFESEGSYCFAQEVAADFSKLKWLSTTRSNWNRLLEDWANNKNPGVTLKDFQNIEVFCLIIPDYIGFYFPREKSDFFSAVLKQQLNYFPNIKEFRIVLETISIYPVIRNDQGQLEIGKPYEKPTATGYARGLFKHDPFRWTTRINPLGHFEEKMDWGVTQMGML